MEYFSSLRIWFSKLLVAVWLVAMGLPALAQTETSAQAAQLALQTRQQWAGADIAATDFRISSAYTEPSGLLYAYPQQLQAGIPVYNQVATLVFKGGTLRHHAGAFLPVKAFAGQPTAPAITAAAAVAKALASTGAKPAETPRATSPASGPEQQQTFSTAGVARRPLVVRLVWATDKGTPRLAWNVNVDLLASADWLNIRVDAATGQVLGQDNWTVNEAAHHPAVGAPRAVAGTLAGPLLRQPVARPLHRPAAPKSTQAVTPASYIVVPYPGTRPDVTTPTTVTNPWLMAGAGNNATTYGWHYDGTTDYLDTRGNNVWAYDDSLKRNAPGRFAASTGTASNLIFNYVPDFTQAPTLGKNRRAATVNLFYWNNLMHDVLYQYGFTEASANFQTSNLGRGGSGGDYVQAEAQDGLGTNNANFSTPPDGTQPRMQMYLFSAPRKVNVTAPAAAVASYGAIEGTFSTNNKLLNVGAVSGPAVFFDDTGTSPFTHFACGTSATSLTGKIALISSLNCTFTLKVKAAQNAGAIGVIVLRGVAGQPAVVMGGTDNSITIPAVMVSYADGITLGNLAGSGLAVTIPALPQLDGDFDSGIMAHEYGHGISNRLTGGGSNTSCLGNAEQAGEGWSDYFALMMTTNWPTAQTSDGPIGRVEGAYSLGSSAGFRRYPYSTSLAVNPLTYADMAASTEEHDIGEIWCATLWDMTWNIIQQQGSIEPNLYNSASTGGNAVALQLVMQGLKLQPCQPGFLDGRDAILAADSLLYNGQYHCAIWNAFARRGMGFSAREGSSTSATDQTAAYDVPNVTLSKNTTLAGTQFNIAIRANCECPSQQNTYSITDQLPTGLQYLGSSPSGSLAGRTVTFANQTFTAGQTRTYQIQAQTAIGQGCLITYPINDDRDANTTGGLTPAIVAGTRTWAATTTAAHSGTACWLAPSSAAASNTTLTSAAFTPGSLAVLSFYQYANLLIDSGLAYDGGLVAISTDNGTTWTDAAPYFLKNGYDATFLNSAPVPTAARSKPCFSGRDYSPPTPGLFTESQLDLSSFSGQSIRIRFQLLTNTTYTGTTYGYRGWYVDDVQVMNGCGGFQQVQLLSGSTLADSYLQPTFLVPNIYISSFTPASGPVGTSVTLTGLGFAGATAVSFNGTPATFTVVNNTTITTTVPAGATTGLISVTAPLGTAVSSTPFAVGMAISSFTPTFGPVGTSVTITGIGFTGATSLSFNGTPATFAVVSSTTITATVPAGATTGLLSVSSPLGTAVSSTLFIVGSRPLVSSLSPARNARAVARNTNLGITFDQPLDPTTASAVRVYSAQRGGQLVRGGNATASASTLTIDPATDLRPGETVQACIGAGLKGSNGLAAAPHVYQLTAAAGGTGIGSFQPGSDFATGLEPLGVAVADVDGDGDLDLLSANYGDNTVSVRTNNGSGAYSGSQNVSVGGGPYEVTMADVDGDGDLDLLTANFVDKTVSVRLNNGTGTFGGGTTVSVVSGPQSVAVGDVDGDGDLDLLAANYLSNSVSVWLNGGDNSGSNTGTFSNGTTVAVGNLPADVALGDVDGDGDLDLLTANVGGNSISVRLNGGDGTGSNAGTFSNGSTVAVGVSPFAVALGDVDGDGDLDFAATNYTDGTVSVRLNNGTGTFAGSATVAVGVNPLQVVLGDVDADGDLDLAAANYGATTVSVALNGGNNRGSNTGTFSNGSTVTVGSQPYSIALGDVDGDGDLDLLAANSDDAGTTGGSVSVRLNTAPTPTISSFAPTSGVAGTTVAVTGTNLGAATSLTVNGVSVTPTVSSSTSLTFVVPAGCSPTQSITVTAGVSSAANTAFTVRLAVASTSPAANARSAPRTSSAVGLTFSEPVSNASVTTAASQVKVHSAQVGGRKAGTWTGGGSSSTIGYTSSLTGSRASFQAGEVVSVTVPATVLSVGGLATPKRVYQFVAATGGQGQGQFSGGSTPTMGGIINQLALGDVNNDGKLDMLTTNYSSSGAVNVALNNGSGGYNAPTAVSVGSYPINVNLADIDGDGDLDFVTCNYGNPSGSGTTATVCLNNGTGTFPPGQTTTLSTGAGPRGVTFGDLDGDGDLDLLIPIANGVTVWLNNGGFTLSSTVGGINFSTGVTVGDVDGDGDLDLAANSYNANTGTVVYIRLNNGAGAFSGGQDVAVGQGPFVALLGDLDGDGDLDLASSSQTNNTVSIRFNNGSGTFAPPAVAANGEVSVVTSPASLALGDIDADGDLDLVAGSSAGAGVSVRLNNGSGLFTAPGSNGTVAVVANFVTLADVDNDGDLDLAATNNAATVAVLLNQNTAPLPVELMAFTATAKAPNVQLNWRTASEKNSARFEVERSLNGQQFDRIGEVAAQGSKISPTDYAYLDSQVPKTPSPQVPIYYRLRQVDLDGTATYSPVRAVTLSGKPLLTLYPNPAHRTVTVGGVPAGATVEVFDALGRLVAAAPADAAGTAQLALPAGLAAGVYVVRSGPNTLRLMVE